MKLPPSVSRLIPRIPAIATGELPFAGHSRGTHEFAELFRRVILRYVLPLTAVFVAAYLAVSTYVGTDVSSLAYVLLAVCGGALGMAGNGRHGAALRVFLLSGLVLITLLNYPGEGRPNGFATAGCYLYCLYPMTWWFCFPGRAGRLAVLAFCVAAPCLIAAAGQYPSSPVLVPNAIIALSLVRSLFVTAVAVAFCQAFEVAIKRFDDRWRDNFAEQESLGLDLRNHARDLAREAEAHRETLYHLSQSETRLRYLFDHAFDGIVVFDGERRRAREVNARLPELLGYSADEFCELHPLDISPATQPDGRPSREARAEIVAQLVAGETLTYEWTHLARGGKPFDFEITTFPLPAESHVRISVFRDVTARNRATSDLEAANRELRTFAHAASHDLKEPLRTMSNFAKLLSRRYTEAVGEEGREYIGYITDAAKRGTDLVQDLLVYAEVGTSEVTLRPTRLDAVAVTVRQNLDARLAEADAVLDVGPLPTVFATPTWAQQLLQNLISNALKFSREGVRPEVRVACESNALGHTITVADNGIGIGEEDLERVFGVFQRLVRREQYEGNGIGLALCRRIAERLGGDISISSQLGEGTTFRIWLPPCTPEAMLGPAAQQAVQGSFAEETRA